MISALLFDFGGTLDGPAHWLDRFLAQYRAAGIEITRAQLDDAFDHATRIGYGATKIVARFGLVDLVRFLVGHQFEYLRQNGPDHVRALLEQGGAKGRHRIVETVTSSFTRETSAGLEHSREIVRQLKGRFKMGIVSNFYGNLDRILAEARIDRYFDAVADSSKVGIFKPDPRLIRAALTTMRVAPESAAMVGDSIPKDCVPAHQLGLRTVWLCTEDSRRSSCDARGAADFTIGSLDEVMRIEW